MKVFRFQSSSNQNRPSGVDWFNVDHYTSSEIQDIVDPDGGIGNEPTSIPSPFARMDLARTAFKRVINDNRDNTTFHKIVSACLDIAELFFSFHRLDEKVEIEEWDTESDLNTLRTSQQKEHNRLGDTLRLYLDQDNLSFNFYSLNKIYLLSYQNRILGGTSPVTLFFTSGNDLSWVNLTFPNGDRAFDSLYCPLHKRSEDFQIMLYAMRVFFNEFSLRFPEFSRYMDNELDKLHLINIQLYEKLHAITSTEYNTTNYSQIKNGVFIINGLPLRAANHGFINNNSDFEILSNKFTGIQKPLVLVKNHNGVRRDGTPMKYYNASYSTAIEVPHNDPEQNLDNRYLPGLSMVKYPYLTTSDFLEPYIIRTVFPINKKKFFDGNYTPRNAQEKKGYLLPLKKRYFDYFSIEDLTGNMPDGRKAIEISGLAANGIRVVLRIPIKGDHYVEYTRIYYPSQNEGDIGEPDIANNRGVIIENQFNLAVYPFFQQRTHNSPHYRACLMDRDLTQLMRNNKYDLRFFDASRNDIEIQSVRRSRSHKSADPLSTDYFVINNNFDYIQIQHNWASGIAIPLFKEVTRGNVPFSIALDFGTTNTHIELRRDHQQPQAFTISEQDMQVVTLHDPLIETQDRSLSGTGATVLLEILPREFIPALIGNDSDYRFPTRSALSCSENLNLNQSTFALADLTIAFTYEKYPVPAGSKVETNMKWADYVQQPSKLILVERYLENLFVMIRNKIIMNSGDLDQAKLTWFYPSSMLPHRRDLLDKAIKTLHEKYINQTHAPIAVSESIAPFYYYCNQEGVAAMNSPAISMDIGGETTDVVVFRNNQPVVLTSFRFAANAVFGDGYNKSSDHNGFISKYYNKLVDLLNQNGQHDLVQVLKDIKSKKGSEDLVAALFSLENDRRIKESSIPISFSTTLKLDNEFRVVFLLFYSAIVYHIAKLMNSMNIGSPRYIVFSGTGSKILQIPDASNNLNHLSEITRRIYSKVMGGDNPNIELRQTMNPKEVTCKGGLLIEQQNIVDADQIKKILLGSSSDVNFDSNIVTYDQIDEELKQSVINEVEDFLQVFMEVAHDYDFMRNFGVSREMRDLARSSLMEDAMDYLLLGLQRKQGELGAQLNTRIEETLFFYPLIGGLNNLAHKISSIEP